MDSCMQLTLLLSALFAVFSFSGATKTCIGNLEKELDLSALFWSEGSYRAANDVATFDLCKDSDKTCEIKLHDETVIGNLYDSMSKAANDEFMLKFNGSGNHNTFLYFTCEKNTLGRPVLLDTIGNSTYFEWKSLIACTGSISDSVSQMPCYVYDSSQNVTDLGGLTRLSGAYNIKKDDKTTISINICRKISGATGCDGPVCKKTGGTYSTVSAMDKITKLTQHASGITQLVYKAATGGSSTTVNFRCPDSPAQATPPSLTSSDKGYVIDWYTTHACQSDELSEDNSCKLTNQKYGVDIDLSPLSNNGVTFTPKVAPSNEFTYELGMCGTTVKDCKLVGELTGRGETVACQRTKDGKHNSLGMSQFRELKYIDDTLTMIMSKGAPCSSHFPRQTIIYFHCNKTAGIGQPVHIAESDCSYKFDWDTSYACNQRSKCTFTDPADHSKVYDFSSLSKSAGASWTTQYNDGSRVSINICQPVGDVSGCDPSAAVCVKKTGSSSKKDAFLGSNNLGQASTMNFSKENEMISITYDEGAVCNKATGERHKSIIYFACDTSHQSRGPQLRMETSTTCKHVFMWFTSVVCERSSTTSHCSVTSNGYTYDFTAVSKQTLSSGGISFNPCHPLTKCGTATDAVVCNGTTAVSKTVPSLVVVNNHVITTTYQSETGQPKVIVRYICDHMAEMPTVLSFAADQNPIHIEVKTTSSCAPIAVDCKPSDAHGNTYDLSGLTKSNWEAESSDHMNYYFSLCSPLDRSDSRVANCTDGISACQQTTNGELVNLGYAASNPEVTTPGTIRFHYINGKDCFHGNKTPRQTTVTLTCSDVEKRPTMTAEDDNCNYNIWWHTPKACSINTDKKTSSSCDIVVEGIKYDLSSLNTTTKQVKADGSTYFLAVCNIMDIKSVPGESRQCSSAAVCVKKVLDQAYSLGDAAGYVLHSNGGDIRITYSGGKDSSKSVIRFHCARNLAEEGAVQLLPGGNATYRFFEWKTSLVCAPLESVNCTRRFADGSFYDLSSLTRHSTNYVSHLYNGALFYLNICHRLLASGGAINCPAEAAVCMKQNDKYLSLGGVDKGRETVHRVPSAGIYIAYTGGDACPAQPSQRLSSLIMLKCNKDRKIPGEIEVAQMTGCRQDFILETAAACPVNESSAETVKCGVIGDFDTTPLKKQYTVESSDHNYVMNFCGATGTVKTCNETADFGVCQISKSTGHEEVVAGKPTMTAETVDGRLVFNFTNGVVCKHDPRLSPRNVVLSMYCSPSATADSQPVFIRETKDDCTYHIYWPRRELCTTPKVPCTVVVGDHVVDLSGLSDGLHYAVARQPVAQKYHDYIYEVSVCKPLPADVTNKCPGASLCRTKLGDQEIHKDLGFVNQGPTVDSNKQIQLVYNTSIKCESAPSKTVSSIIKFTCGKAKGAPFLTETDGCTYTFSWATSEACHDAAAPKGYSKDCKLTHKQTGQIIDLSPLKGFTYKADGFKIQVCSAIPSTELEGCAKGSAVCGNTTLSSSGLFSMMQLVQHGDDVILQYDGGDDCRDEDNKSVKTKTMIEFVCDPTAGRGEPELLGSFETCVRRFRWKTAYVCLPDCILVHMGHTYDFGHLTSQIRPYKISSKDHDFTINICKNLATTSGCDDGSSFCAQKKSGGGKYALALTSTLKPQVWGNGVIALTYTSSDSSAPMCSANKLNPTVLVKLTCANHFGQLKFDTEVKSNCTFIFTWSTYVACTSRQEVGVTSGTFTDPSTKALFSINDAFDRSVTVTAGEYSYDLSLSKPLESDHCTAGSTNVCQYKTSPAFSRAIGKKTFKHYYQDGELQTTIDSDSVCGRRTYLKAMTVINFVCNEQAPADSTPTFVDETMTCRYLFKWELSSICAPSHPLSGGAIAAIVVSILVVLVGVAGLVVYKVKRRRRWDGEYDYNRLSADDDTTMLVSANKGNGPRFYDDDDDEIII